MTTTKRPQLREFRAHPELVAKLTELAWQERKSLSGLLRDITERFADRGLDGVEDLAEPAQPWNKGVKFVVNDELWKRAEDKAWELRTTRVSGLRRIAVELTRDVTLP